MPQTTYPIRAEAEAWLRFHGYEFVAIGNGGTEAWETEDGRTALLYPRPDELGGGVWVQTKVED